MSIFTVHPLKAVETRAFARLDEIIHACRNAKATWRSVWALRQAVTQAVHMQAHATRHRHTQRRTTEVPRLSQATVYRHLHTHDVLAHRSIHSHSMQPKRARSSKHACEDHDDDYEGVEGELDATANRARCCGRATRTRNALSWRVEVQLLRGCWVTRSSCSE